MTPIVHIAAPWLLAISLFVETSSWWVRAQAPAGSLGLYVSRSNIYLYFGRFFSLAFTSVTAFTIESGAKPPEIAFLLAESIGFAALMQAFLLSNFAVARPILTIIARSLRLPTPDFHKPHRVRNRDGKLLGGTAVSALIFGIGTGLPLIAAVLIPEYRMSVAYIGQIVNSLGTLLILVLVDQLLFRALDAGTLPDSVVDYGSGRIVGFLFSAVLFAGLGFIL